MLRDPLKRALPALGMVAAMGMAASACGGTTHPSTAATHSSTTTASVRGTTSTSAASRASTAAATTAITSTWTRFFSYDTAESTRITLLQDGSRYSALIASALGAFPKGLSATVKDVKVSGSSATVSYSLQSPSGSLLPSATGTAVEVGGRWLVSSSTFCGLAALAQQTCPS